jgi:hypothetical protein
MPWDRRLAGPVAFYSWGRPFALPARSWEYAPMQDRVPLSTLLSQALVAFTMELDNEADHRLNHKTTIGGGNPRQRKCNRPRKPWVVPDEWNKKCSEGDEEARHDASGDVTHG